MAGRTARAVTVPILCAAALAVAVVLPAQLARAEPATLTIVHVNDLDRLDGSGGRGGVARLAAVVREVRAGSAGRVLVTNGGDAISPSLLSSFDRGAHMIDLFNRVGFDAMVLGNHEFDFTPAVTVERIAEARFPILSSNAVEPDGTLIDGVTGHLLLEVGRYKVGVFGLTTVTTAIKSSPAPVTFRPVVEVAAEQAEKLREAGADLVIALAHTDRAEDAALMRQGAVDLLLSGDDHDMKIEVGPETTFVESGEQAEFVTVVEVVMGTVEGRDGPRFVWEPSFRVVNTVSVAPDPRSRQWWKSISHVCRKSSTSRSAPPRWRSTAGAAWCAARRDRHRQPDRRRHARRHRRRRRPDQRWRHPRRQGLSPRHDPDPARRPVGASLRRQDGGAGGERGRSSRGGRAWG